MSTKKMALLMVSIIALSCVQPTLHALGGGGAGRESTAQRERRLAKEAADKAEREKQEGSQRELEKRAAEEKAAREKKEAEGKVKFEAEVRRMSGLAVSAYNKYLTDTYNNLPRNWDAWQKSHGEMSINPRTEADLMKEFINDKIFKEAKEMTGFRESGVLYVKEREALYASFEAFVKEWAETKVRDWNK